MIIFPERFAFNNKHSLTMGWMIWSQTRVGEEDQKAPDWWHSGNLDYGSSHDDGSQ